MSKLRAVVVRLTGWFGRTRRERNWNAEFESHLQMHVEDNLRAGMNAEQAQREALVKFGGIESVKESLRDRATLVWIDTVLQDVRYAMRNLKRDPGFAITVISSMALGLGASLAVFTLADNLLQRQLPYRDPSRLVMVWEANRKNGDNHNIVAPADYLDWKAQNDVLDSMAALRQSLAPCS